MKFIFWVAQGLEMLGESIIDLAKKIKNAFGILRQRKSFTRPDKRPSVCRCRYRRASRYTSKGDSGSVQKQNFRYFDSF